MLVCILYVSEIPWDPYNEPNPEIHWNALNKGISMIKEKLGGTVDAIGGSSAGVLIDNEVSRSKKVGRGETVSTASK